MNNEPINLLPVSYLWEAVRSGEQHLRLQVVDLPGLPDDLLFELANDDDLEVRTMLAGRTTLPEAAIRKLWSYEDEDSVRHILLARDLSVIKLNKQGLIETQRMP